MKPFAFRVLNWNIQNPSLRRATAQLLWLEANPTEVIILSEVKRSQGTDAIVLSLRERGYSVHISDTQSDKYGVLLAVAHARCEIPLLPEGTPQNRFVSVICETLLGRLHIGALYVPSRGPVTQRNHDKRLFQAQLSQVLPTLTRSAQEQVLIGGDLNVIERTQAGHTVFGEWEYQFYDSFTQADLIDAYRFLHPHGTDCSWYGRSGRGYRFDHLFVSDKLRPFLLRCEYLQDVRQAHLSDHAAMIAEFHSPERSEQG